jgi:CheY-like chemotaxis protein
MVRMRALVAEDDADLLEVVTSIIDRFGLDVIAASCGASLLETLTQEGPFDVVVTDVAMPWMTGLEVMHFVRSAGLSCPVIIMTALREHATDQQVATLGQDVVLLRKPFSVADLHAALSNSLAAAPH